MPRKKKKPNVLPPMNKEQLEKQNELQASYMSELELNPKYSLNVDPENKYSMSDLKKMFVKYYIEFRNVNTAADLCNIDMDAAKELFKDFAVQNEIRRINLALYQRQFATKLLDVDQLGGYLSSLLIDAYTPIADRLTTNEKLRVVDMLLKLNELKAEAFKNPTIIIEKDINEQLKDLSVDALKALLSDTSTNINKKVDLIDKLDKDNTLTMEDKAYLETLSTTELLQLINDIASHKGGNNE